MTPRQVRLVGMAAALFLAAAGAAHAAKARTDMLTVRTGQHERFGRLVFDWRSPVAYTVRKTGSRIVIRFAKKMTVDLEALNRDLPSQVAAVTAAGAKGRLALALSVAAESRARHFRDGTHVVLDVIGGPAPRVTASAEPPATPAAAPPPPPRPRPAALAAAAEPPDSAPPANEAPDPAPAAQPDPPKAAPPPQEAEAAAPAVAVQAERGPDGLTLRFDWPEETGLAAYRRGGRLWLLFDRRAALDLGGLQRAGRSPLEAAAQVPYPGAAWVRLDLVPAVSPVLKRDGTAWVLRLAADRQDSARSTDAEPTGAAVEIVRARGAAAKVRVAVPDASRLFRLFDPDSGEELFVVPVRDPANAVLRPRAFVQFDLLRTEAGVVVRRKGDAVAARIADGAVEILAPGDIILSDATDAARAARVAGAEKPRHPLAGIADWRHGAGSTVAEVQHRLMARIMAAPGPERNAARMRLARFYLARRMPAEALGVLAIVREQDLSYERDPQFRALRGAASVLLGHYGEAAADLTFSFLEDDPSVAPWLAALSVAKGDWPAADNLFRGTEEVLAGYPDWLATRFALQAAEAALVVNDVASAGMRLEALQKRGLAGPDLLRWKHLHAFLLKKEGKVAEALDIWRTLARSGDRRVRAKAAFAETEALLERKDIDAAEAIRRLEGLIFAWRGDAFEYDLLKRLGDLHSQRGDYRDALNSYRQAVSYFDGVEGVDALTRRMSDMFDRLFLRGGADALPVVSALALYQEFRELTPAGEAGDEMIRKLADRLARADLLREAAKLLDHQVEFRVHGRKKAEVGARLATIHIQDLNPSAALSALAKSGSDGLPPDLAARRRLLRAEALGRLGRASEALAAIAGDDGRPAEMARLSIHWRAGDWDEAAGDLKRLFAGRGPGELGPEDPRLILRWAVALALGGDEPGLAALRDRFGAVMAESPRAEAFEAIAGRGAGATRDYRALVARTADVETFEAFLAEYRARADASGHSAMN